MVEIHSRNWPGFRPRRERCILNLGRVIELSETAGHREAGCVAWTPDNGIVLVFFRGRPDAEVIVIRRGFVFDRGDVFVGQRRVDERVLPGKMARNPVADDRRKLSGLDVEPAILPRGEAQRVFIQPQLRAAVDRIESPVYPGLGKEVEGGSDLRVKEQTEPRIEKRVAGGEDQARGGSVEVIRFLVQDAAEAGPDMAVQGSEKSRPIQEVRNS